MSRPRSLMVDIETKATDRNAFVLSIGCVAFDDDGFLNTYEKTRPEVFYGQVPWDDKQQRGRVIDPETMDWWDRNPIPRRILQEPIGEQQQFVYGGLSELLTGLNEFVKVERTYGGVFLASRAAFDFAILQQAFRYVGLKQAWQYRDEVCMTGFVRCATRINIDARRSFAFEGHELVPHHAADDAMAQTNQFVKIQHEVWKTANKNAQQQLDFYGSGPRMEAAP